MMNQPDIDLFSFLAGKVSDDAEQPAISVENLDDVEIDDSLDLDQFQVVRREFFYHLNEPSVTFNNNKIGVNTACIRKLPETEFIQFLVSRTSHKLALRPCQESESHSLRWCNVSGDKRKPRCVTGRVFFLMICDMMGWNPNYRFKILGKLVKANGEYLILFDLDAVETYEREEKPGGKVKTSRTPVLPLEWKGQFGVPFKDHQKSLQINIVDNSFAVYSVQDDSKNSSEENESKT